jgi:hypothetical protein
MVANHLSCTRKDFPIVYLGLPLATGRLRRSDIWPLIDKYSRKLKGWKPRFLMTRGRLTLTRSVLMALPLHLMSVLPLPQWALDIINKRCRGLVWKGEEEVNGVSLNLNSTSWLKITERERDTRGFFWCCVQRQQLFCFCILLFSDYSTRPSNVPHDLIVPSHDPSDVLSKLRLSPVSVYHANIPDTSYQD